MFFKKKDYVGNIFLGKINSYMFGESDGSFYVSIYTDKDISVMVYGPNFLNVSKDDVFYLHCDLKGDEATFRISKEGDNFSRRVWRSNMTLRRFNNFFEEEKLNN